LHITPKLPLGHESLDLELETEWRFRVIYENNLTPTLTLPLACPVDKGGGLLRIYFEKLLSNFQKIRKTPGN